MDGTPLRLAVIIGSTRQGRVGHRIGGWFAARAAHRTDLTATVLDLAGYDFPPRYPAVATPSITAFTTEIERAEAFAVVTPEYNHGYPASLKQAIDYGYDEWQAKPVAFVSYGYESAGRYAVEQLRTVFTELHVVTMRDGISFNLQDGSMSATGEPAEDDALYRAATVVLDQLAWWGRALRDARTARPYVW